MARFKEYFDGYPADGDPPLMTGERIWIFADDSEGTYRCVNARGMTETVFEEEIEWEIDELEVKLHDILKRIRECLTAKKSFSC